MTKAFEFVDSGRTFRCSAEAQEKNPTEKWWWFSVSSDLRTRYAPFRAAPGDTESSVRSRIKAYYDHMIEVRNAPPVPRWNGRPKPIVVGAPGAPVVPVVAAAATKEKAVAV